eukprot:1108025-Rhodomonas_salina.1
MRVGAGGNVAIVGLLLQGPVDAALLQHNGDWTYINQADEEEVIPFQVGAAIEVQSGGRLLLQRCELRLWGGGYAMFDDDVWTENQPGVAYGVVAASGARASVRLEECAIRESAGVGVAALGGSLELHACTIHNSLGAGVVAARGGRCCPAPPTPATARERCWPLLLSRLTVRGVWRGRGCGADLRRPAVRSVWIGGGSEVAMDLDGDPVASPAVIPPALWVEPGSFLRAEGLAVKGHRGAGLLAGLMPSLAPPQANLVHAEAGLSCFNPGQQCEGGEAVCVQQCPTSWEYYTLRPTGCVRGLVNNEVPQQVAGETVRTVDLFGASNPLFAGCGYRRSPNWFDHSSNGLGQTVAVQYPDCSLEVVKRGGEARFCGQVEADGSCSASWSYSCCYEAG